MKPEILLIEPMMPEVEARLDASYHVHRLFQATDPANLVAAAGPRIRAIVTGGGSGAPAALVDTLPALEIIAINGIGTDAVDLQQARARGIRVTTTPDVLTDDVADMAFALMLAVARRICTGDRLVREGRWLAENIPLGRKVSGKRLGILGLGRVGRAVARRAEGFGMTIAYTDLRAVEGIRYRNHPILEDLARESDVLVIAAAGGPGSREIVGTAVLDALGPDGVLVNVARGSVVDEPALVAALTDGRLGGAGLDVFAHEPEVPPALLGMQNVVLAPHQASATVETRRAMADLVLGNLEAHFAGREPLTAIDQLSVLQIPDTLRSAQSARCCSFSNARDRLGASQASSAALKCWCIRTLSAQPGHVPGGGIGAVDRWPAGATVKSLRQAGHLSTAAATAVTWVELGRDLHRTPQ